MSPTLSTPQFQKLIESNPSHIAVPGCVNYCTRFSASLSCGWRMNEAEWEGTVFAHRCSVNSSLTVTPFSIQLLERENEHDADASRHDSDRLLPHRVRRFGRPGSSCYDLRRKGAR